MSTFAAPTSLGTSVRRDLPAVEVENLTKVFRRRDPKAGRFARRRMPALKQVTFSTQEGTDHQPTVRRAVCVRQ